MMALLKTKLLNKIDVLSTWNVTGRGIHSLYKALQLKQETMRPHSSHEQQLPRLVNHIKYKKTDNSLD